MKTIMIAAMAGLMLSPAAFAAAPMAPKTVSKPALSSQTTQGGAILLVKGNNKPTSGGAAPSSKTGKSSFFDAR
ncbi:hypothetical protein J1C56_06550 [Aminobacter anthyllidis]|uniref:Uncharacterized protein n=1 Tax=Aminobacter anthyllidis TaxID=1035067 RepID=A0A9X1A8L4_9HYPH|nr:hypothetical protein [Aminobacter anthyllidis]MBT1155249.1 hypothetical protein [Aminobacter anthyllidis]MDH4985720.1 hypothetical protein [Aminobacter anthyllidis]